MSGELLERAQRAVNGAMQRGAQGARANLSRVRQSRVEWRDEQLDRIRQSTTMSLSIALYVDGRYSSHGTSDLRPEALDAFLDEAVAMTRLLAPDENRHLPDPARYADRFSGDLQLYDESGASSLTGAERRRAAQALVAAARSAPGNERIVSISSSWGDGLYESALATSNGMQGSQIGTSFSLFCRVNVRDDAGRRPVGYWYSVTLHRGELEPIEAVGREATRRALMGLGERPRPSGTYPCVIDQTVAPGAIGWLLAPLQGQAIQQQRSFLADKRGSQITSPVLSITDDPHLVKGFDSAPYDSEGMSTRRMPIIDGGTLRNFYLNTYYADKLGMEPTTGSSTNLTFSLGDRDRQGLLAAMDTGLWITDFQGGNSNGATGDFSVGVRGQWVEKGVVVHPVAEMNLGGNHLECWKQLVELGNDPNPYSSCCAPSLRFGPLQFSGA
jgi:PmbA protein